MTRSALIPSILACLLLFACSPAANEVPTAPAVDPPPEAPAAAAPAPQGALSPNYLDAARALYMDDFDKARIALEALAAESTGDVKTLAQASAETKDLSTMRAAFKSLSDVASKMELPAEYAVASCPMFKPGSPSRWVQKKGDLMNPYFGKSAAMATCGTFVN